MSKLGEQASRFSVWIVAVIVLFVSAWIAHEIVFAPKVVERERPVFNAYHVAGITFIVVTRNLCTSEPTEVVVSRSLDYTRDNASIILDSGPLVLPKGCTFQHYAQIIPPPPHTRPGRYIYRAKLSYPSFPFQVKEVELQELDFFVGKHGRARARQNLSALETCANGMEVNKGRRKACV